MSKDIFHGTIDQLSVNSEHGPRGQLKDIFQGILLFNTYSQVPIKGYFQDKTNADF